MTSKGSSKSSITLGGSKKIAATPLSTTSSSSSSTSTTSPTSPRGSVASGIKSKSSITFSHTPTTTPSLSSPSLSSSPSRTITSSVSSSSFQYWKEKESVSTPSSPSSQSPLLSSQSPSPTSQSPKLSSTTTSATIGKSATSTSTNSPIKKSIFSIGKKSASSSTSSTTTPNTTTPPNNHNDYQPATISSGKVSFGSNLNTKEGDSNSQLNGNNSNLGNGSSTLPNRMNNRKSLKNPLNIFSLDFWSNNNNGNNNNNNSATNNKNEEMGNSEEQSLPTQEQSNDSQKVTQQQQSVTSSVNNNKTPPQSSPILTSGGASTIKSKSTIGSFNSSPTNTSPITATTTTTTNNNNSSIKKSFISNSSSNPPSPANTSPVNQSPAIPIRSAASFNVSNNTVGTTSTTATSTTSTSLSSTSTTTSTNNVKLSTANKSKSLSNASPKKSVINNTVNSSMPPPSTVPIKPNLLAPKKVSPTLQSTTTTTSSITTPASNISLSDDISTSNGGSSGSSTPMAHNSPPLNGTSLIQPSSSPIDSNISPFDPDELNLARLKSKISKSDVERLVNLEFYTRVLAKDLEDITGKLVNEVSMRKDLESHTKELEARLRISEARLKRYSTMPPSEGDHSQKSSPSIGTSPLPVSPIINSTATSPPPPLPPRSYLNLIQAEKDQLELEETELSKLKEEREDQRISSLLVRMDTLEKKVASLESRNSQLQEEIHHLQTENQLLNPDRKKTLKKLGKEKEKELQKEMERQQREKEREAAKEKEKEKQRLKDLLKLQKEREKEGRSSSFAVPSSHTENSNSSSAPIDPSEMYETDSNGDTGSDDGLRRKDSNGVDLSPHKKNVVFNDGKQTTSSSKSYLSSVTLRKNTAKRMSAHYGTTTSSTLFNDSNNDNESIDDNQSTTSEKVKAIFHDIYDGNIEEMKNQKLTRMRSKSLSRDASGSIDDDESIDDYNNQPSSAAKLNFSNSASSITGSLSLTKDNVPISLCTSFDSNQPNNNNTSQSPSASTPTLSSAVPTSKPDAMEKIRHLTIGRMSSKKKPGFKDAQLQLSEKLNHRASKNELIFKSIIKAESIFGVALAEDTSDRLMDYLNKSIDYLLDHSVIEGLFSTELEDSKLKPTIESIENTLITDFSNTLDPCLVASTFFYYFSKLPTLLLAKISNQLIHAVEIDHPEYRRNVIRSLLFSLPPQNRNILKIILHFLKKLYNQSSNPETDQDIKSVFNRFAKSFTSATPGTLESASKSLRIMCLDIDEFEAHTQDIQYMVKDNESIVKAASFDRLVEKLFDLSYSFKDPDYNYTIFHTYDYYTTSCELLERFIHYYRIACTLSAKTLQMEMSITVLSVAMFWMKIHHNHLMTDLAFLQKLKGFIDSVSPIPSTQNTYFSYFASFFKPSTEPLKPLYERGNSFLGPNLTQSHGTSKKKNQLIEKMMINGGSNTVSGGSVAYSGKNVDIDFLSIGANILAQQITIIDNEMLMAIPPSQFLHKAFTKYSLSPQFHDMVAKFNEWARWTSSEILSKEKLVERVVTLAFFIDLAKNCVELGNYNAANAIVGGLNHSSISRLKLTWERLSTKVTQDYDRLISLFDLSMNYKNYREELKSTKAKIIPYLGIFPKDLIAIEEGNENFTTSSNLINTEKFRLLYGTIKKIQSYQQPLFNIKSNEPIKLFLKNISNKLIEENQFHSISTILEPRK